MQTTKARAKWLKGGNAPMWEISHPDTRVKVWTALPRDGAAMLLEKYVVWHMTEPRTVLTVKCELNGTRLADFAKRIRQHLHAPGGALFTA